jgi:hypothetical protein
LVNCLQVVEGVAAPATGPLPPTRAPDTGRQARTTAPDPRQMAATERSILRFAPDGHCNERTRPRSLRNGIGLVRRTVRPLFFGGRSGQPLGAGYEVRPATSSAIGYVETVRSNAAPRRSERPPFWRPRSALAELTGRRVGEHRALTGMSLRTELRVGRFRCVPTVQTDSTGGQTDQTVCFEQRAPVPAPAAPDEGLAGPMAT